MHKKCANIYPSFLQRRSPCSVRIRENIYKIILSCSKSIIETPEKGVKHVQS